MESGILGMEVEEVGRRVGLSELVLFGQVLKENEQGSQEAICLGKSLLGRGTF